MLASVLLRQGGLLRCISFRTVMKQTPRCWSTSSRLPARKSAAPSIVVLSDNGDLIGAPPPNLLHNLRAAASSYELFEIVSLKRKEFSAEHVMTALKRLFHLQKNENTSIPNKHLLKNPDFEHLCRNLKHAARTLDVNDLIEAMKILNYCGVPPNSTISMTLLHLVRNQINDISLGQIVFLEFLMKKFDDTPLVEAFRIALPMLMQIQLAAKLDHENAGQLTDLLQFATRNPLSAQARMNIVSALTLHGTGGLTLDEARSCVWSLAELEGEFGETHARLLHNCLEVLCDSMARLSFEMMETTLAKCVARFAAGPGARLERVEAFYDEEFYGRCAQYVIDKDVGFQNALYVQRKFNRINFVSVPLMEYVTEKMCAVPERLSEAPRSVLLTYLAALSTAYYRPHAWDTLKPLLRRNAMLRGGGEEEMRADVPWLRFALELVALDVVEPELLSRLCEPAFVRQMLQRSQNTLDMLQLLLLHQVIERLVPEYRGNRLPEHLVEKTMRIQLQRREMPLRGAVERCFGGADAVRSGVVTRFGHFVDHVVVFGGDGEVVRRRQNSSGPSDERDDGELERFEDVKLEEGERAVAVVTYPRSHYCLNAPRLKGMFHLRVRTLETLGMPVCVINADAFGELPDREKLEFIEREVRHRLA